MQLYPAIDLHHGQCVRLFKGDYYQQTTYSGDPLQVASDFVSQGATWLHIVDLTGAKDPKENQVELIGQLAQHLPLHIQMGGGIRSQEQIQHLFDHGVSRVIIGSLAVTQTQKVKDWINLFGNERVVLAFDCKVDESGEPVPMLHGWVEKSATTLNQILQDYQDVGLKHVLCTDIDCDGTLQGPNIELYKSLLDKFPDIQLQASGGIKDLNDIRTLNSTNMPGAIIGKALYERRFTLEQALEVANAS